MKETSITCDIDSDEISSCGVVCNTQAAGFDSTYKSSVFFKLKKNHKNTRQFIYQNCYYLGRSHGFNIWKIICTTAKGLQNLFCKLISNFGAISILEFGFKCKVNSFFSEIRYFQIKIVKTIIFIQFYSNFF